MLAPVGALTHGYDRSGEWGVGQAPSERTDKKKVEIESLLQWAFLDELPKRLLNATGESGERYWRRLEQYGYLGGVDVDEPAVQRYAYVGEPHPDAIEIEKAVARLGSVAVDWATHFETIAAELAALIDINRVSAGHLQKTTAKAVYDRGPRVVEGSYKNRPGVALGERLLFSGKMEATADGRGVRARPLEAPRDVIAVNSVNLSALVHMHAIRRSRPFWRHDSPVPLPAEHKGRGFAFVGEYRGKNLYSAGSYCPLRWSPSPLQIILDRADYFLWHQALTTLAETLRLAKHIAELPAASAAPWIEPEDQHRLYEQTADRKGHFLPFPPEEERPRAGVPNKKPRHSAVRQLPLDTPISS